MNKRERRRFGNHRSHARGRGITFELTPEEWLKIWHDSGHFLERGYVMARFNDKGSYAVGNVEIITIRENLSQPQVKLKLSNSLKGRTFSPLHRAKLSKAKLGNKNKLGKKESISTRFKKHQMAYERSRNESGRFT